MGKAVLKKPSAGRGGWWLAVGGLLAVTGAGAAPGRKHWLPTRFERRYVGWVAAPEDTPFTLTLRRDGKRITGKYLEIFSLSGVLDDQESMKLSVRSATGKEQGTLYLDPDSPTTLRGGQVFGSDSYQSVYFEILQNGKRAGSRGFNGGWNSTGEQELSISLGQTGSQVSGSLTARNYGVDGRYDVPLSGTVRRGIARVQFPGLRKGKTGLATLRRRGNTLTWNLLSAPGDLGPIARKATLKLEQIVTGKRGG